MQHLAWNAWIVWALFLVGMGAGSFMVAFVLWQKSRIDSLMRYGFYMAPFLTMAGLLLLLLDLGRPERFWRVMIHLNIDSMMSLGFYIQSLFVALALGVAWLFYREMQAHKGVSTLVTTAMIMALLVGLYHGMLPASMPRAGWDSALVGVMFVSSLLSGRALLGVVGSFQGRHLDRANTRLLVVLFAVMFGVWFYGLSIGTLEEQAVVHFLLVDWVYAPVFIVALALGVVAPLFAQRLHRYSYGALALALIEFASALIFKYGAIVAGQLTLLRG